MHPGDLPLWPFLMVTVSCGAISGFHSTQSPILARTLKRESEGRKVFYGAMVAEGIIALIWAAAGMAFFNGTAGLQEALASGGPAGVVNEISKTTLGTLGRNTGRPWCDHPSSDDRGYRPQILTNDARRFTERFTEKRNRREMVTGITRRPCGSTYIPTNSNRLYLSMEICGLVESSSCDCHALDRCHLFIATSKVSLDMQSSCIIYDRSGKFLYFLCTRRVWIFPIQFPWCLDAIIWLAGIDLVYYNSKIQTGKTESH